MRRAVVLVLLTACGGSSAPPPQQPEPEPAPDPVVSSLGADICDALVLRVRCAYDKAGIDSSNEARRAFEDAIDDWRDALAVDATRQATIDACTTSLDAGYDGLRAQGCWAVGDAFDDRPAPERSDAPSDATPIASLGDPTCDLLVKRISCSYEKAGNQVPPEAMQAFRDSVEAWREALANHATRQATIDACMQSLDAADDGFTAQGC